MENQKAVQLSYGSALTIAQELRTRIGTGNTLEIRSPEERAVLLDALLLMENEIQNEQEYYMAGQSLDVTSGSPERS